MGQGALKEGKEVAGVLSLSENVNWKVNTIDNNGKCVLIYKYARFTVRFTHHERG